jgi:hypothetical protein
MAKSILTPVAEAALAVLAGVSENEHWAGDVGRDQGQMLLNEPGRLL